jgi:hypothetical protein
MFEAGPEADAGKKISTIKAMIVMMRPQVAQVTPSDFHSRWTFHRQVPTDLYIK